MVSFAVGVLTRGSLVHNLQGSQVDMKVLDAATSLSMVGGFLPPPPPLPPPLLLLPLLLPPPPPRSLLVNLLFITAPTG